MSSNDRDRWNIRHGEAGVGRPSEWLRRLAHLPDSGSAMDVAGGSGGNALLLAERGMEVTLVDLSDVALSIARREATRRDLDLETLHLDLETEPLPKGPWHVILCFHYLQRALFEVFPSLLASGGLLICELATTINLEQHSRPPAQYLLDPGEITRLVEGLDIVEYHEEWTDEGRHEARLVARRP